MRPRHAEIAAGEPEEESLVAVRRARAKPAKSGGKKAKAAAKPAAVKSVATEPAAEPAAPEPKSENMNWFILKVQSNREESIREGLLRRVAIAGLDCFFGDVIVPTEKVTEVKRGRSGSPSGSSIRATWWSRWRSTRTPGSWSARRRASATSPERPGTPTPMLPHEVNRILAKHGGEDRPGPQAEDQLHAGDRVKINEGTFENFEGEVDNIDETNGRVTVMIKFSGGARPSRWNTGRSKASSVVGRRRKVAVGGQAASPTNGERESVLLANLQLE